MRSRRISAFLSILVSLLALASLPGEAGANQTAQARSIPSTKSGHSVRDPNRHYAAPRVNTGDWPTYGHDVSRTSFNPDETLISAATVNQLVQGWQRTVNGSGS